MRLARKALTVSALVAGVGAAVTGGLAASRTAKAEAAYPPIGQFVTTAGGRVHYVQAGSGPDVILLHGAGGNLREFTFDLIARLKDDYRVTAFDRPGHGYTDRVPGVDKSAFATEGDSPADQVAMLREAAAALGITRPIVAGHSYGGAVAMAWAVADLDADTPQNAGAVVSFAGVSMPWPGALGWYYTVNGSALGGATIVPLISAFVPGKTVDDAIAATFAPQEEPPGYASHIGAPLTLRVDSFRANTRQVNTLYPHVVAMVDRYPELTLPIEIIHGTADTTVPISVHPERLVEIVQSARLTPLPGIGHMPHQADPQAAVDAIGRAAARAGLQR